MLTLCGLLLLCGCAQRPPPSDASMPVFTEPEVDPLPIGRLLEHPGEMTELQQFPASGVVSNVSISRGLNTKQVAPLTTVNFLPLLDSARALDPTDENIRAWHYAPWHTVTFSAPDGQYQMSLFLGGRGFLRLPDGNVGPFEFEHPE
jgi:hypothetical protein